MGRIKQTYLKRIAEELLEKYPQTFTEADFEKNKKLVDSHTDITSKSIRNKIAGYLTRTIKQRAEKVD